MKYYDTIPSNFLLMRFVVTRQCNFRCPYCYLSDEKRTKQKTVFLYHSPGEWADAIGFFADRHLELYFTGGEPLLIDDFVLFLEKVIDRDYIHSVRIDSNLSKLDRFMSKIDSPKIQFLASLHPTQVTFNTFMKKAEQLREKGMLALINLVVSRENVSVLDEPPHRLADRLEDGGMFLNLAKDFERGLKYGYHPKYKEYIDKLQYPIDNIYMNMQSLHTGAICGGGKHYISLNRHGNIYSCGGQEHGNIFSHPALPRELVTCNTPHCPSIISYSFSASNDFSPVEHLQDYIRRNKVYRQGLDKLYLDSLWQHIKENDLIPQNNEYPTDTGKTFTARLCSRVVKKIRSLT